MKEKIRTAWQHLIYRYRLATWNNLNRVRQTTAWFRKHHINATTIRWAIIIGASIFTSILVLKNSDFTLAQGVLSNYLIAVGAMAGGTIAIVFTISLFLLQNAADLYSSQYLEVYIHDWKEKIIYFFVVLITIFFFGTGLYVGGLKGISDGTSRIIVSLSLFFVGLIFILIDWQYKNVRSKINPVFAIAFLQKRGIHFIKKTNADGIRLAKIFRAKNREVSEDMALATAYNHYLQPHLRNLDRQLENLSEIAMKLAGRKEFESSKRGYDAIHNILCEYFDVRKKSSLVLPSGIAFLAVESDSQGFLTKTFERLNNAGEIFITENKIENASHLIDVYGSLALKTRDITFIGRSGENPILEHLTGYLNFYIQYALRLKNIEIIFQGARALGNIGIISAQTGLGATLTGVIGSLSKIAIFGITEKQTVITDRCNSIYLELLQVTVGNPKIIGYQHFDDILRHIATTAHYFSMAIASGHLPNDFGAKMGRSKAYDEMYTTIAIIMRLYDTFTEPREKEHFRSDLVHFFEELYKSLRKLGEDLKSTEGALIDSIGRLIFNVNDLIINLLLDGDFTDVSDDLKKWLSWNINLPYWFVDGTKNFDAGSNPFNTLSDSIARTGILIFEKLKDDELVIECVDSIYSLAKAAVKKSIGGSGYDEPRLMVKACYLGILALKHHKEDIFIEAGLKIYEFEPKYQEKYFSNLPAGFNPDAPNVMGPKTDQLYREIMRWRRDFWRDQRGGMYRIMGDAHSMMYELIDEIDIDRFVYEVWHMWIEGTAFDREMEEKFKRNLIKRIIDILKNLGE